MHIVRNSVTVECLYTLLGTSSMEMSMTLNTSPVNILNVEIKIRNVPFVLSHFHSPEDGGVVCFFPVEWVYLHTEYPFLCNALESL